MPRLVAFACSSGLLLGTLFGQGGQEIVLDGAAPGKRFDGIGIVNGGGATSVLLKDYPEPQRSQILDLVFKPKFGASVSALLVEIPGDGNSTQGSMPSHMRTREDLNFTRGYMWCIGPVFERARHPFAETAARASTRPGFALATAPGISIGVRSRYCR